MCVGCALGVCCVCVCVLCVLCCVFDCERVWGLAAAAALVEGSDDSEVDRVRFVSHRAVSTGVSLSARATFIGTLYKVTPQRPPVITRYYAFNTRYYASDYALIRF